MTTSNPLGLGYQTGFFSGTPGTPLNQSFFDAAFASRLNDNKIYREAYHCNLVDFCGMSQWLDEFMGYTTDCFTAYTLLETYGQKSLVKVATTETIAAYPAVTALHLDDNSHFVNGAYILPQVGNTIVLTPIGELAEVVSLNLASAGDSIINIRLRNTAAAGQVVTAGDNLLVLSGSELDDCECPVGQFAVNDAPIEFDVSMIDIADKGDLCGKAMLECQWLKIPFYDECGNEVQGKWYNEAIKDMYTRHEKRKHYERLLHPSWGVIPIVRARGLKWTPASTTEITTDDVRTWKQKLDQMGIGCREFAIFAGGTLFSQFQRMLLAAGVVKLDNTLQPNRDCKWIDMNYCGISVEGLTLHIYEECTFSNGFELGSGTSVYPASAIIVPMCKRPACRRSTGRQDAGGGDDKMMSMVYFRDIDGRVWDSVTDSNGYFGPRNSFGVGCKQHEWSIESHFLQELHCANQWGFMGLT